MSSTVTRRDFLKVAAGVSLLPILGNLPAGLHQPPSQDKKTPNIIIILFDALSATNLSLYGYPRKTSSAIEKLAERSIVYHAHHAAGNFTAPSTASLFSGTYPWKHRVFNLSGMVQPDVRPINLPKLLPASYYQAAMVQNMYADILLYQFSEEMKLRLAPDTGGMAGKAFYPRFFPDDAIFGAKSIDQFILDKKENPASFFLSLPLELQRKIKMRTLVDLMSDQYPEGVPVLNATDTLFTIDRVMEAVGEMLTSLPAPFFSYIHLMPPHAPYRPSSEFLGIFDDGWVPKPKKHHRLATRRSAEHLNKQRQKYDEYLANLDAEFGKLLDGLEKSGLLENSYVIVTSDHGEFFERGQQGHVTPLLFEALTRIPLVLSTPGQRERHDIFSTTSNVDLMPTLLNIAGVEVPDSIEGHILPGLGGIEDPERSTFTVEAKRNFAYKPIKKASIAMWLGSYKLIRYMGYKHYEGYEFYDLESDPGELENRYESHPAAREMQVEMDRKLKQADIPYQ